MVSLGFAAIALLVASPALAQSSTYGVGRTPTPDEIRALDISIGPTGEELPPGHGTAKEGATLFQQKGMVSSALHEFVRVLELEPHGEMAEDARDAIESIDGHQMKQIIMLAGSTKASPM